MLNIIKTCAISIALTFVSVFFISQFSFAQSYACFPTCKNDARFFVFAGDSLSSFIDTRYVFGMKSPGDSTDFHVGFFDGDDATSLPVMPPFPPTSHWDQGGVANIIATLYADPNGEGAQVVQLAQWSGDGSIGNNTGNPMADNAWSDFTIPNVEAARTPDGDFRYTLVMESQGTQLDTLNQFKIRTKGTMIILPQQEFAFFTNAFLFPDDFSVVWPNYSSPEDDSDPTCVDAGTFLFVCGMLDPGCCIAGGPYDGTWKFFIDVPEGQGVFNVWDGDFDFGSSSPLPNDPFICEADGIHVDSDDPNTPNEVPDFAMGTGALPEGVNAAAPPDDICRTDFQLPPSVNYDIITPLGDIYNNANPSGSQEWEIFNIGSVGDVDVLTPGDIPGGIWTMMVRGTDFANLNGLRFDYPVVAVDENDEPVPFDPPDDPVRNVPTLNEWAMAAFLLITLFVSVYYLRFRRMDYRD